MVPDLGNYRWIVVNSSGGKDSQAALRVVWYECTQRGVPLDRIVVSHQCLGRMEWPGTLDLAKRQAKHYGLRFLVESYQDKAGARLSLLDYVRQRRKWPSSTTRFCTSEFKRSPGGRVLTRLSREAQGNILNVYGFRAEESPARKKKPVFARNQRWSSRRRTVHDWLPIHDWTVKQVWDSTRESGVPHHPAYDKGMPRLSCVFCIFAPRNALLTAGLHNPELLDEYCALEAEIGHTFQHGRSLASIREALQAGERPAAQTDDKWNM